MNGPDKALDDLGGLQDRPVVRRGLRRSGGLPKYSCSAQNSLGYTRIPSAHARNRDITEDAASRVNRPRFELGYDFPGQHIAQTVRRTVGRACLLMVLQVQRYAAYRHILTQGQTRPMSTMPKITPLKNPVRQGTVDLTLRAMVT